MINKFIEIEKKSQITRPMHKNEERDKNKQH